MERYYRMIIDLYKEVITNQNHQVNSGKMLEVQKELANALTATRIKNEKTTELETLLSDVEHLKTLSV